MNKPTFRAWWIKEKEMHNVCKLDFKNNQVDFCGADTVKIADIILMQSTGLKDKHGVVVYVGDIVKCSSGCPHEMIFKLENGGNVLGGMPTFYLSGLKEGYQWMGTEEVIGNIHENPELLKEVE